jgi:methylated-DNA-[protein]-cysteine S-methyltransferase
MSTLYNYIKTPLGDVLVLSDGQYLTGLMFKGQKHMPKISVEWRQDPKLDVFTNTELQILEYFNGSRKQFDVAYRTTKGTPFQQKVWRAIAKVGHGTTISYRELAKLAGCATSIRAVATAAGKNPLSIVIPCHRIIGITGDLSGYAGGIHRKNALITLEHESK